MVYCRLIAVALITFFTVTTHASDLQKEQRWESQIVDAILDGEAIHLDGKRSRFLAIETPSADESREKTAIIMHGTGVHPDWPTVIQPLRVGLTESDWHTLSIQMPILPNEAEHKDYAAIYDWVPDRLDTAIEYAREQGAKTVVLIGHSQGTTMTAYYLTHGGKPVDGFIAIGMGAGIAGGPMDNLNHLKKLKFPMLDLFGSQDLEGIVASADKRKDIAGGHNPNYSQIELEGADHFFEGEEELLLEQVNAWLQSAVGRD
ncbi:MAG: alpha/beta hydrolase family protein [Candidatus Thiodiazotropha sp. (ex Monitilora ramsayi)]|nr:alpha/beta hydrolase family protein [Candidatus Thiodiazotropha sp. (ex Monitilora ramsayi)]